MSQSTPSHTISSLDLLQQVVEEGLAKIAKTQKTCDRDCSQCPCSQAPGSKPARKLEQPSKQIDGNTQDEQA